MKQKFGIGFMPNNFLLYIPNKIERYRKKQREDMLVLRRDGLKARMVLLEKEKRNELKALRRYGWAEW